MFWVDKQSLLVIGLLALLFGMSHAYSQLQLNQLLVSYGIPPSLISQLKEVNVTYAGINYTILYKNSTPYFVVNTSSNNFVLNATSIYEIIRNITLAKSLSSINATLLANQMQRYQQSSAGPLYDCLFETGLASGLTCTPSNYCQSCQTVPVCRKVLVNTSGPTGVLGIGIEHFENAYDLLNSSYSAFYANLRNITSTNAAFKINALAAAFANISNITTNMYRNPIFPPVNVTPNMLATCINYPTLTSAPWFCTALGFCEALTFNYTLLNTMQNEINALKALPLSNQGIFAVAQNTSSTELLYIEPVLSKQRLSELQRLIATNLPNYNQTVTAVEQLLTEVNSSGLANQLIQAETYYGRLVNNYLTENLTQAVNKTAAVVENLTSTYRQLNASYAYVVGLASNNTARLIEAEITNPNQKGLVSLSFEELGINNEINKGGITNLTQIELEVQSIANKAKAYQTGSFSLVELARAIDGAFGRPIAYSLHLSYNSAIGLMPWAGALLSLIIGLLVVFALKFMQSYLVLKKRLVLNARTRRNWRVLFVLLGIAVIVYVIITFALVAYANAYAPFSAFSSAVHASNTIVILTNGTPSLNTLLCSSKLYSKILDLGKQPVAAYNIGGYCRIGNATVGTIDDCLNAFAVRNEPVIMITNSSSAGISLYSLYGTVLYYSGNASIISACYPEFLLN